MKWFKQLSCCHIWHRGWHPDIKPYDPFSSKEYRTCPKCGKQKLFNRWDIPFDCRYKDL